MISKMKSGKKQGLRRQAHGEREDSSLMLAWIFVQILPKVSSFSREYSFWASGGHWQGTGEGVLLLSKGKSIERLQRSQEMQGKQVSNAVETPILQNTPALINPEFRVMGVGRVLISHPVDLHSDSISAVCLRIS